MSSRHHSASPQNSEENRRRNAPGSPDVQVHLDGGRRRSSSSRSSRVSQTSWPLEGLPGPPRVRRTSISALSDRISLTSEELGVTGKRHSRKSLDGAPRRGSISSFLSAESWSQEPQAFFSRINSFDSWTTAKGDTISRLRDFVHSRGFSAAMFILTCYVLFGDDLRLACFSLESDPVFNGITVFSILLFTFELIITSISVDDYFLSFFFLLDIVSTVSLILDLTFVWDYLVGNQGYEPVSRSDAAAKDQSDYARAGRSSRVGTRVARILRVFRLIRMARMVKIVSVEKRRRDSRQLSNTDFAGISRPGADVSDLRSDRGSAEEDLVNSESRVGKKLSEKTTLWVIVLVLLMLIVVPLLDPGDNEAMMLPSALYGVDVISQAWHDFVLSGSPQSRQDWEQQVLMYAYYHNLHATCPDLQDSSQECVSKTLAKLCFIGYLVSNHALASGIIPYIQELRPNTTDWDAIFTGSNGDWTKTQYVVGHLPEVIKQRLARPWKSECRAASATVFGVSLMSDEPCPWRVFRPQETERYTPTISLFGRRDLGQDSVELLLMFDITAKVMWEAVMSMVRTVFIIIVLTFGALMFSTDADNLVLHPIERMISKVEKIRQNPLYAIKLGDEQFSELFDDDPMSAKTKSKRMSFRQALWVRIFGAPAAPTPQKQTKRRRKRKAMAEKKMTLETKILENTIIKLGSLLALGFGEAGSEIIGHNLDDDNVAVDAMIPGRKVEAIYGYCQIKEFTITTEVLKEKTMVFVNQVAEIVHRIVDEHLGAANKNVGDAFLLVWRIGLYEERLRPKVADLSVMSFIQVLAATNRDRQLAEYREHPALLARSSNYRVRLGFGLHLGWSIEGAIGSEFKIDASYLSSHVNMAFCLETVTRQYGVMILMSEALVRACTKGLSYFFRAIDYVKLQGAKTPTRLFTVDLDASSLNLDSGNGQKKKGTNRYQMRRLREQIKIEKLDPGFMVHDLFATDRHIKSMRAVYFLEFFQEFERGYLNYEAGEWDVAAAAFKQTSVMLKNLADGPSCALLDYMCTLGFQAPTTWAGYRELSDGPVHTTEEALARLQTGTAPISSM